MIIYVFFLASGKYYIGKTEKTGKTPQENLDEHIRGNGTAWTKKYIACKIIESYESDDIFEEDNLTR